MTQGAPWPYDGPDDADDLERCMKSAKDAHEACIKVCRETNVNWKAPLKNEQHVGKSRRHSRKSTALAILAGPVDQSTDSSATFKECSLIFAIRTVIASMP